MDESSFLLPAIGRSVEGEAELVVSVGANQGYAVTVRDELWIGRDRSCDLQLFDEAVSGRHCHLYRKGEVFYVADNGSRNGTFLNHLRVTSRVVYHRDDISCGATTLKFLCPSCPNPKKTTVAAAPAVTAPPVEKIETPMETEQIEAALLTEAASGTAGVELARSLIRGHRLLQTLAQQTDWQDMFRRLLDGLPELVPHETAVLCRYNAKTNNAFPVMHRRPQSEGAGARILMDQDLLGRCCAERRCIAQRQEDGRWILVAPMCGMDRILGVLYLETARLPDPRLALAQLAGVCRQAGLVLMQCELVNAIRQQKLQLEEAARAVGREKSKLDALLAAIGEGIALVTPAGDLLLANPGGRECLESLCRRSPEGRLVAVAGEAWPALVAECPPERKQLSRDLADDGRRRHCEFSLFRVPLGAADCEDPAGDEHGYALQFRDTTERKHAEESLRLQEQAIRQMQKLEAIGTLAGGLAHEFNNILATISTEAAGALEFGEVDYARESLRNILDAAGSAAGITRELLNFAKPQDSCREPFDLVDLVGRALNFVKQDLRNQRVDIVLELDPVAPAVVDGTQIQQVFVNILTNARDAMSEGGTLRIAMADKCGGVETSFDDTGTGIPPQHLHRIFDPFFTTKGAYGKSKIPGTGLGLSVAMSIVRSHGGNIVAESVPGRGTHVAVWLPRPLPGSPSA